MATGRTTLLPPIFQHFGSPPDVAAYLAPRISSESIDFEHLSMYFRPFVLRNKQFLSNAEFFMNELLHLFSAYNSRKDFDRSLFIGFRHKFFPNSDFALNENFLISSFLVGTRRKATQISVCSKLLFAARRDFRRSFSKEPILMQIF